MANKHIIICVGRQLGSGGHDIARMLAMDFNAKYYDRELLNLAAKESGFSEKVFEQNDERKGILKGLLNLGASHVNSGSVYLWAAVQSTFCESVPMWSACLSPPRSASVSSRLWPSSNWISLRPRSSCNSARLSVRPTITTIRANGGVLPSRTTCALMPRFLACRLPRS